MEFTELTEKELDDICYEILRILSESSDEGKK